MYTSVSVSQVSSVSERVTSVSVSVCVTGSVMCHNHGHYKTQAGPALTICLENQERVRHLC